MGKKYAGDQAIPAWMKVKDTIVETEFSARRVLAKYRASGGNPALFRKLKDKVVTLYDLIRQDYDNDKKLQKKFPGISDLGDCLYSINNKQPDTWWIERYKEVTGVIYCMGITKITMEGDDDDDTSGWDE